MESFSIIDAIVNELGKDTDLTRMKKVIYCACEGIWENDETKLEEITLKELIEELYNKIENIETLDSRLSHIVSKVNKKTEYSLLTQKLVSSVGRLYPKEENIKIIESTQRNPGKLFDVREKIMQGTNPLKAKILLFSIVEHQFNFGERDWLLLKTNNLDSLLRQIFNLCTSIRNLKSCLYSIANKFEDQDEYTQVANVIINALAPCYSKEIIVPQGKAQTEKSEASKLETEKTNIESDSYFQENNVTWRNKTKLANTNYLNEISFQEKPLINSYENLTNPKTEIIYKSTSEAEEKNLLDPLKQKLEIENEILALVNQRVDTVMDTMEAQFISLEENLNNLLQGEPKEKRLSLKYTALGYFISNIQDKSTKFREIRRKFEIEERKKFNLNNFGNTINKELKQAKEIYDENQQKIIELATQGNPKAVAIIINQLLRQQRIIAMGGKKNGYLHIVLESEQVPNQEIVTPVVQQKIASLQSEYLKNVKIHGKQSGNRSIIWTTIISG